jgi:hypothetical protein
VTVRMQEVLIRAGMSFEQIEAQRVVEALKGKWQRVLVPAFAVNENSPRLEGVARHPAELVHFMLESRVRLP